MGEKKPSLSSDSDSEKNLQPQYVPQTLQLQFDLGEEQTRFRKKWWQLWLPANPPPPPPASLDDAPITPFATASIFSQLTYSWMTDIMILGYQRTLQASDLWKMNETREAGYLSAKLDDSWNRRVKEAEDWNSKLDQGIVGPGLCRRILWCFRSILAIQGYAERRASLEKQWREFGGRMKPSLAWSLNDTFGYVFWLGGLYKVVGDTAQLMGPLLVKAIINFSEARAAAKVHGTDPPNIGRGVAMGIGLFCVVVTASVSQHQFFFRSMTTGVLARAALINSIYKRGVNLTPKARTKLTNAALVNHISTDVSRIDACAQWFHAGWTAPIQVTVCLIILLVQLGPSALAGFCLFILVAPIQERVMAYQFRVRSKANKWTDQRAKILMEVLGAMRVVKYFCNEAPFLQRIFNIRRKELSGIQKIQISRSANIAFAFSVPVLAATLAFVTYTLTAHDFNVAIIFASLSLFQLLRQPLMFLPRALSATSDAQNALVRLTEIFHADIMIGNAFTVNLEQKSALQVTDAIFEWEDIFVAKDLGGGKPQKEVPAAPAAPTMNGPFQVRNINLTIPRGQLVAIVGRVGSGKSSLLQGIIGEMRKVHGQVSFGGRVAYCPQTAWIQNATLRDNVVFGQEYDEDRYWRAIEDACLLPDLQVLPDGDLTEIGEKGVNLSGGQKQRVNIARALYYNPDIAIFDDPLSAVDAHVGKSLFHGAIIAGLRDRGKAVILVTHALHFLSHCDYIYTLNHGAITEQGTYQELVSNDGDFARLDKEFGGSTNDSSPAIEDTADAEIPILSTPRGVDVVEEAKSKSSKVERSGAGSGKLEGRLMVKEKRTTGSVSWSIYGSYIAAGRGYVTIPLILVTMLLMQGSSIMNSYTLVWWQANTFHRPNSFYQILYAALGLSQALFTFLLGVAMDFMSSWISENLHHQSIHNIFHAPMSFFDTTPMGRVLSIFGKDIDNIDNQLPVSMRLLVLTVANVIGAVLIITILEHYFIIAAFAIAVGYSYFAAFYRAGARELKRLDSMLRSVLYGHFSESLTGLPTIRCYGKISQFIHDNSYYIDLEDRALFLTVTNQRWLAIRLDFMGAIMVCLVALFAVTGVSGISPAQIGLVLSYTTSLTQMCGLVTRQTAEVENYMNSVERVVHYSRGDLVEQEAPYEIEDRKPPPHWPMRGEIEFKDLVIRYRPKLPVVLHGISMTIHGGEKIGVVGRTGAGKSSLILALVRIVEAASGSIVIDGTDISKIGLRDLRSKISIIPQEPLLFSGTVRTNLDPFSLYDDVNLWDALRRSFLVETSVSDIESSTDDGSTQDVQRNRITLDTVIEAEGANLSLGQRSLVSLARALVKETRVVVLDEATASVDLETDSKIQRTIQTEFKDRTLICIAHRLRTIINYDRILVLDAGEIAEFDTPTNLFMRNESIFRGLCDRSNITLQDIQSSGIID